MKVLIIASFPDSVIAFRGPMIDAMLKLGYDVEVAAPGLSKVESVHGALQAMGAGTHDIPLQRTGTNPLADLRLGFFLFWLMRKSCPDITLPYTIKPVVYGTLAAWLAGVPRRYAFVTGLGFAFTGARGGVLQKFIAQMYHIALRLTHKVLFQNPDDQRHFREAGILPKNVSSAVVNGSGVDTERYAFSSLSAAAPVFLMIGRLLGDKGVREYVEAASRVRRTNPEARFQLMGWIDCNPNSIRQSELDGWIAAGVVEFLGRAEDVRPAIENALVYVLPSYREGTPRTVLEAMAIGRPIITTDAPGCRETVIDGVNGYLVEVGSVDSLERAMRRFLEQPHIASEMGRRSREIAEEKYDVHKVNAAIFAELNLSSCSEKVEAIP